MSIPFADQSATPAGDIVRRQLPITSRNAFAAAIKNVLVDAGWTADPEGEVLPTATITFTGIPGNNEVCVIGTVTYTWKTTLTGAANEVLRGVDAPACASNLFDAITDNSPNEGITYGTGTVENPDVTAEMPTTTSVKITGRELSDAGLALSENSGATSWNRSYLGNSCIGQLWSGRTPQGLQFKLEIWDSGQSNYIDLIPASYDGTIRLVFSEAVTARPYIQPTIGAAAEIIASQFHLVIFYPSFSYGYGACYIGTVHLPQRSVPLEIASAVRDTPAGITDATNTAPIVVTCVGHGLPTGRQVALSGVLGNTAANNTWVVTKIDDDTFSLNGSTGNGEYAGGGEWIRTDAIEMTIDEHELENGDSVYIDRGSLDPEKFQLNGRWTVTVVDANTVRLRGSNTVLGDAYDEENPSLVACPTQCSQAVWAGWDKRNGDQSGLGQQYIGSWRNSLPTHHNAGGFRTYGEHIVLFNGVSWWNNVDGDFQLYGTTPGRAWWGNRYWLREAVVGWSTRGYNGSDPAEAVGFLFNAAVAMCNIPMDSILTDTDGKKWLAFSYDRWAYGAQLLWQIPNGYN